MQLPTARRCRLPEVMDQPGLDKRRHFHALRGLERINYLSRSAHILWPPIHRLLLQRAGKPVRLLDIACGAGDVAMGLNRKAAQAGLPLEIDACDISMTAVEFARARVAKCQPVVRYFELDLFNCSLPPDYDVITNSLFLHHLDEERAIGLLRAMSQAATHLILVNDLVRCFRGLMIAYAATRLLSSSPIVHIDGPRSVAAAFTTREVSLLADKAGLHGAILTRRWPCRFLLSWWHP